MTTNNNHKNNRSSAEKLPDQSQPFWLNTAVRTNRRGHFWIAGDRVKVDGQTLQRGPMFVEWQAPDQVTQPYPIVLVHGGLLQGTEWLDTPDGRPGWAQRLAEAGYAVLVVDRPGHGRSHTHPDIIGPIGHAFSYEEGEHVFFPPGDADKQTQWPFDLADANALDSFIAAFGPLPADFRESQEMDAERLSRLLDKVGPAILMTHSASGPLGWLVADKRPELVVAIVSVEPMGPAFITAPGIGTLNWGLTAAPVKYDPPRASAEEVQAADPLSLQIPAMKGLPIAIVTGEASVFATHGPAIVRFLNIAGAAAEQLHLPDYGILGNGHGLIYEKNSDEAIIPVLNWLAKTVTSTIPNKKMDEKIGNTGEETN
jgi:pimeloyl-ACP methyl ester carboxylesterase